MGIVDSDTHFFEPVQLWREHLDPACRDAAPRLVQQGDRLLLEVDRRVYPASPVHAGLGSLYRVDGAPQDAVAHLHSLSTDPARRLERMDRLGIAAEIVYPTIGMMGASEIDDPVVAAAHARAYNRFAADRSGPAPQRLRCAMIAPLNHPEHAAAEMSFARERLGLTVLAASCTAPARPLSNPELDVVWATAQDLDLTVTFQDSSLSAGATTSGLPRAHTWRMLYLAAHVVEAQLAIADMILGGVLERFPRLRVGFHETHLTWIPSWLQLLDERFGARGRTQLPSEAFRQRCFASGAPDEPGVRQFLDAVGSTNLLFSSDWPHRALVPGTDDDWTAVVRARPDLTLDEATAVLEGNPKHWFST